MTKKSMGFAVWISVVLVLALLVFGILAIAFTTSFKKFWENIRGYSGNDIDNLKSICKSQCDLMKENEFCCGEKLLGKEKITCLDKRLKVECNIDCEGVC